MSTEEFEQQKKALFDLINSWDEKNLRLAALIWQGNPDLEVAVKKAYSGLLQAKDYRSLSGLRLLANLNAMDCDSMDEKVQYMMKIRWIRLNHANFDIFPAIYLRDLEKVKIHSTVIVQIPEAIKQLKNLQSLDLDGCRNLQVLPKSILELKYLNELHLRGTGISDQYDVKNVSGIQEVQGFLQQVFAK